MNHFRQVNQMTFESKQLLMAVLSRQIIKRTKKVLERVMRRVMAGRCLNKYLKHVDGVDQEVDCDGVMGSLGLCDCCRSTFYRESAKGTTDEQWEYRSEKIREGLVLEPGEIRDFRQSNSMLRRRA
jgi:hypothetical protein